MDEEAGGGFVEQNLGLPCRSRGYVVGQLPR